MNSKCKFKTIFAVAVACAAVYAFGGNGNAKTDSANAIADFVNAKTDSVNIDDSVNEILANVNASKLPSVAELKARMDENAEIIALLKALYEREVETASGRTKWHGKLVNQIVKTNELEKVSVYADGKAFKDEWKLVTPKDMVYGQAKKVAASTNGIPAKLAAARLKRAQAEAQGETEVVVTVEVGKQKSNNGNEKGSE